MGEGETPPPFPVRTEKDGPLSWILLDRPKALNALNSQMLAGIDWAISATSSDIETRVILIGSTSNVFAAGADVSEMVRMTVEEAGEFLAAGHCLMDRIDRLEKPVIAVVDGYALGGGLELALSADFIVASEMATFGLPEVSLGIIPGFGGTQRLSRLVGTARAKMLILGGLKVKAREAYEMGLVARLFPPEKLKEEAKALALTLASRAPLAVGFAKEAIRKGLDCPLNVGLALERKLATETFGTEDLREGMRAFLERRAPTYKGR